MTLGGELTLKKLILFIFVLIFNFSFSEMYYKGKILEKIKNPTENTLLFNDEIENGNIKRIDFYKVLSICCWMVSTCSKSISRSS